MEAFAFAGTGLALGALAVYVAVTRHVTPTNGLGWIWQQIRLARRLARPGTAEMFAPNFDPDRFGTGSMLNPGPNCYAWALDDHTELMVPGWQSVRARGGDSRLRGSITWSGSGQLDALLQCDGLTPVTTADTLDAKLGLGWVVALFAVTGDEQDFHFYRHDADGKWSHKPGQGRAERIGNRWWQLLRYSSSGQRYRFIGFYTVDPSKVHGQEQPVILPAAELTLADR
jgi:hypothetical protein